MFYFQTRYYDPSSRRFVTEDPGKDGRNWYIYCDDNPANELDSNGQTGKFLKAVLSEIKNGDAFKWGIALALESCLLACVTADCSESPVEQAAAFSATLLVGEASVVCFAVGLGADGLMAGGAGLVGLIGTIAAVVQGETAAASMGSGANAIAFAAISAVSAYSLEVCGALALDACS